MHSSLLAYRQCELFLQLHWAAAHWIGVWTEPEIRDSNCSTVRTLLASGRCWSNVVLTDFTSSRGEMQTSFDACVFNDLPLDYRYSVEVCLYGSLRISSPLLRLQQYNDTWRNWLIFDVWVFFQKAKKVFLWTTLMVIFTDVTFQCTLGNARFIIDWVAFITEVHYYTEWFWASDIHCPFFAW